MAIMVKALGTVDYADTTKLYAVENHFKILSEGDPEFFYHSEGDYVIEEAAENEVMPSELLEFLKHTTKYKYFKFKFIFVKQYV